MNNAFLLGLNQIGLETGLNIITYCKNSDTLSQTNLYLGNFFLYQTIPKEWPERSELKRAHTFFTRANTEQASEIVRIEALEKINLIEFIALMNDWSLDSRTEIEIANQVIERKLKTSTLYGSITSPDPIANFISGEFEKSSVSLIEKFLDELIVNYPEYDLYLYYQKLLLTLSSLNGTDFVTLSGGRKFTKIDRSLDQKSANILIGKIQGIVEVLDSKYPEHPLTLDSHLIVAKSLMIKDPFGGKIDFQTLQRLQQILVADKNKLGFRYLMVKEFVATNKFHSK
jgi:hypothetical protein